MVEVHTFIPALRRQKQGYLCDFEASLLYRAGSRIAKDIYIKKKPCLEKEVKGGGVDYKCLDRKITHLPETTVLNIQVPNVTYFTVSCWSRRS